LKAIIACAVLHAMYPETRSMNQNAASMPIAQLVAGAAPQ
jgi:hypothetical protein